MIQLIVKSENKRSATALLLSVIHRQMKMITTGIQRTQQRLKYFEEKYHYSTQSLLKREAEGTLDDNNLDIIEWLGESRILERLETEYQDLVGIEICS